MPSRSPVQGCCCSFIDSSSAGAPAAPSAPAAAASTALASSNAIAMNRHVRAMRVTPRAAICLCLSRRLPGVGQFAQCAMHELHATGTFTDRGGDTLDAAAAHVTDREDSRQVGLEQVRLA